MRLLSLWLPCSASVLVHFVLQISTTIATGMKTQIISITGFSMPPRVRIGPYLRSCLLIVVLNAVVRRSCHRLVCSIRQNTIDHSEKLLLGDLITLNTQARLGNVAWETLSFLAIAENLGRRAALSLSNPSEMMRVYEYRQVLPKLFERIKFISSSKTCYEAIKLPTQCCRMHSIDVLRNSNQEVLLLKTHYLQSFKFFNASFVQKRLISTPHYIEMARTLMVDPAYVSANRMRKGCFLYLLQEANKITPLSMIYAFSTNEIENCASFRLCVHVRREDFAAPGGRSTEANFTLAAIRHIINKRFKAGRPASVIFFGNDYLWTVRLIENSELLQSLEAKVVNNLGTGQPVNDAWIFSQNFCDVVLITASTSTYGWVMAYVSHGHSVYYKHNADLSANLDSEFEPSDFFLPHWIPLRLMPSGNVVEVQNDLS